MRLRLLEGSIFVIAQEQKINEQFHLLWLFGKTSAVVSIFWMTIPLPRENQQRPQAWQVSQLQLSDSMRFKSMYVVARNVATNAALPVYLPELEKPLPEIFATTKREMHFNFFLWIPTYRAPCRNCSFVFCSCATTKMFPSNKRKRILDTFSTHYFALEKLHLQQKEKRAVLCARSGKTYSVYTHKTTHK